MERLYAAGIRDVILAAGYMPQAIVDYFGDGSRLGLKVTYVIEETPLGTAGAIKNVEEHITRPIFRAQRRHPHQPRSTRDAAVSSAKRRHRNAASDPRRRSVAVRLRRARCRWASRAFIEKPPKGEEPTNEINAGTYLLERRFSMIFPPGRNGLDRARDVPAGDRGRQGALRLYDRRLLARSRTAGAVSRGASRRLSGDDAAARRARNQRRRRRGAAGHPGVVPPVHAGARRRRRRERRVGPNVVLGKGCSIGADADDSRIGPLGSRQRRPGAVIEEAILASG